MKRIWSNISAPKESFEQYLVHFGLMLHIYMIAFMRLTLTVSNTDIASLYGKYIDEAPILFSFTIIPVLLDE